MPFAVGDAYGPESDRKACLFALCFLVIGVVSGLIVINIKSLQEQWGQLHGAEIIAAGVVVLQFVQFILHRLHFFRRSHCWMLVQWGAWAAYYLPVPLATLAVGMMLQQQLRGPFWPVAVLFAAGQSDAMAAYSLDDDSQSMRRFAKRALYVAYLVVALLQVNTWQLASVLVTGFLVMFVHLKVCSMAMIPSGDICMVAAEAASSGGSRTGGPSTSSSSSSQTQPLQRAVVAVGSLESHRSAIEGSTKYEDILGLRYSTKLEDACLSAALFLELLRRHHTPRQRVDPSSANLAFKKLLEEGDYAKALRLVEVQLSFMYDHFFSAHGSPSSASYKLYMYHWVLKIGFLMHILIISLVARQAEAEHRAFASGVICLLAMLELCQLIYYLTSDRFLVSCMCDHHAARVLASEHSSSSTSMPRHRVVRVLNAIVNTRRCSSWQNTFLGQYSLLGELDSPSPCRGQTSFCPIALSLDQMNAWILDRLGKVIPEITRDWKLIMYALLGHYYVMGKDIHTTILTWHIATCLCAMRDATDEVLRSSERYMAATRLSSYCAYLVAFHPELLPTHHTVATRTFDEAVRQAEPYLKLKISSCLRCRCIEDGVHGDADILGQGVVLCRKLEELGHRWTTSDVPDHLTISEVGDHWTILADFWADMMLHLAQSGNAAAHIQHLTKGAEFITRLWALVSNAGMQLDSRLIQIREESVMDKPRKEMILAGDQHESKRP